MEWIRTSEKLPNKGERVLCSTIYGIQIGWITINGDWQFCNDGSQFTLEYWMPLPELPCEGKEPANEERGLSKPAVSSSVCDCNVGSLPYAKEVAGFCTRCGKKRAN